MQEFKKEGAKFSHRELVEIAYKWLLRKTPCSFGFKELSASMCLEIPDVIGFNATGLSILIEVKTSRSDFLADRKKIFRIKPEMGMGHQRFFCCPKDLIKVEEVPDKWGLIYVNDKGRAKAVLSNFKGNIDPYRDGFKVNFLAEKAILCSALRQLELNGVMNLIYGK